MGDRPRIAGAVGTSLDQEIERLGVRASIAGQARRGGFQDQRRSA
jgi:hypothetical protein